MFRHCLTNCTPNFHKILYLPKRNASVFFEQIFEKSEVFTVLLENYLSKFNLVITNKLELTSAIVSGEITNLILKNFLTLVEEKNVRKQILSELKHNIQNICILLEKCHTIYRWIIKDVVIKLAGSMTILPMCNARIM